MDVEHFKQECIENEPYIIVQKYLIDGASFFFDTIQKDKEFEFKKDISDSLNVHIRDIVIIGSGKLGFSIKPDSESPFLHSFKKFDHDFEIDAEKEKSDLDIAIVSGSLFDKQLIELYKHTGGYSNKTYNSSYKKADFANYILKGWLRPDKVPNDYSITSEVVKVQEDYKAKFGRKVNIGIYKSWYFFENYHQNNIKRIKLNLIANSI
jgi:hypothetical protein